MRFPQLFLPGFCQKREHEAQFLQPQGLLSTIWATARQSMISAFCCCLITAAARASRFSEGGKKKKNTQIIRPSKQLYLNPVTVASAPDEGGNLIFLLNSPALISLLARPSPPHNKAVFQRAGPADGHAFLGAGKHGAQRLQHTRPYTQGIPLPPKPLVSFTSSLDRAAFLLVWSHACAGRNLER